ncbi:hypothetical protein [Parapedobacter defluvii]|uniref:hypothetical protein n=1 Tax=Parapedobacter defluvii TaxID=2045106 RepID=UPI0016688709|nr:hypothetical protein [Parapedobacter defluvii]
MTKPPRLVIHIPVLSPNFVPTERVPPDGNTGYHPVWPQSRTVLFARSAKLPFPDGNGASGSWAQPYLLAPTLSPWGFRVSSGDTWVRWDRPSARFRYTWRYTVRRLDGAIEYPTIGIYG